MIVRYFVLFLLFTFTLLFASADYDTLKKANVLVKSSSKSDQFRAYNEYKHLYLRSMVNEDEYLRVKALEGIVKSGTKLHIDVTHYSKELSRVKIRKYKAKNRTEHKAKTKKSKLKVFPTHKLLSARWHDDELILAFDKKLTKKQVHYFTIIEPKKNKYKYIFDFNPIYYVIEGFRDSLLYNIWFFEKKSTIIFWCITIFTYFIGKKIFNKLQPHFGDVI